MLKAAHEYGLQKVDDLIAAVGYGKISARQVLSKIVGVDELREKPPETGLASMVRRVLRPGPDRIKVKGIDDLLVVRARCCNPIRGEKIVGYISRGKGVSVHSASCSNVVNLMYDPDRRIEVEWDSAGQGDGAFTVRLAVQVEDKKGMVAAVSAKVAGMNTNIRSMEATTEDTRGRIDMTVEIADMKHLEKVIKSVKAVSGVLDVERVYR
jgi:guanosine-3',5'-bis(diphosphate) 3'-pyrophosphohydrolase